MRPATILLALILGAVSVVAQEAATPSLFVAPLSGDETAIEYWQPALGEGLAEMLITEEKLVGEVTLDAVQDEKSKASYSGDAEVKSGWVVKAE